jgi:hypothetical protein
MNSSSERSLDNSWNMKTKVKVAPTEKWNKAKASTGEIHLR